LVLSRLNLHSTIVVRDENVFQWWLTARKQLPKLLRRGFDSLFFLVGWLIWKERNARTFNGVGRLAAELAALIQDEASRGARRASHICGCCCSFWGLDPACCSR